MIFRAATFEFTFPRPTLVMGIVNVTPDSFSDGGRYFDCVAAVEHGLELVSEGADIIDVGGESTRPNAKPVTEEEELRRVLPVIEQLARQVKVPISVDTQKPIVARAALAAGASIVNDIAANRNDTQMWQVVAQARAGYVAMHMQGSPETMQISPVYQDVVREVEEFFSDRLGRLEQAGVRAEQVILDVGFGFGKTLDHNLELLAALNRFTRFERPLLLGVSRKSFIGKLLGLEMEERLPAALACSCWSVHAGAQLVRTHDVAATVTALRVTEIILARSKA
jgi:dihydropteroate synthase